MCMTVESNTRRLLLELSLCMSIPAFGAAVNPGQGIPESGEGW